MFYILYPPRGDMKWDPDEKYIKYQMKANGQVQSILSVHLKPILTTASLKMLT